MKILALGDCNTQGIQSQYHNTFVEKLATILNATPTNLGYTMATTREGVRIFDTVKKEYFDIVLLSFGLTDSWETFKYAPYVLYFPDNPLRKISRKIVKKYKKIGKKLQFKKFFSATPVVPKDEYIDNFQYIVNNLPNSLILILDTIPKKEEDRNISIKKFNTYLDMISTKNDNIVRIKLYDYFDVHRECYLDKTHLNDMGYNYICKKIHKAIKSKITNI